jgi:hypothetical protein
MRERFGMTESCASHPPRVNEHDFQTEPLPIASTREATEAVAARRALKREQTILQMCDFIIDGCGMAERSHVIYVGQHKRPVTITGLLPEEFLAVATGVAKMSETLDSELGRATDR